MAVVYDLNGLISIVSMWLSEVPRQYFSAIGRNGTNQHNELNVTLDTEAYGGKILDSDIPLYELSLGLIIHPLCTDWSEPE